jgi:hypothetical protein
VPDFTGRENVYLNGAILGMARKEIDRKFDEIVDFAEMAEFIDTPVKRYSSGMQVKLAFAVATSVDSEILIVDEVLAVGDLAYQRKCFDRMEELIRRQGRTVLLVSHNIRQVQRLCSRVIMISQGKVVEDGMPRQVCDRFYAQSDKKIRGNLVVPRATAVITSGELELLRIELIDKVGRNTDHLQHGEGFRIRFRLRALRDLSDLTFGFGFHTTDFLYLFTHNSESQITVPKLPIGEHDVQCEIERLPLLPGVYSIRFGVTAGRAAAAVYYGENVKHVQVVGEVPVTSRDGFVSIDAQWSHPVACGSHASASHLASATTV